MEANRLWENNVITMPKRYSMVIILLIVCLFFGPIFPGVSILCLVGTMLMSATIWYVILRRSTFKIQIGYEIAYMMANMMPLAIFLYALLNLIFYRNIHGEFSWLTIIAVSITGVFALFTVPLWAVLRKAFMKKVERDDEETYNRSYNRFKHYDLLNPFTHFLALQRLKNASLKFNI